MHNQPTVSLCNRRDKHSNYSNPRFQRYVGFEDMLDYQSYQIKYMVVDLLSCNNLPKILKICKIGVS